MASTSIDILIKQLKFNTGLKLDYYRKDFIQKRIKARMINLKIDTIEDYLDYFLKHKDEITLFLDQFPVKYTYFFRNIQVFEKILNVCDSGKIRNLLVWSCPCATGEEPYSLAMLFDFYKQKSTFPSFNIYASDINKNAIKFAKNGLYDSYNLQETPQKYIDAYFLAHEEKNRIKYKLDHNIIEKVRFFIEDLIKGHQTQNKYHIIFCRNFLMYIDRVYRQKVLKLLSNHLIDGGILVLGITESLFSDIGTFKIIDPTLNIYIKGDKISGIFNIEEGWNDKKLSQKPQERNISDIDNAKLDTVINKVNLEGSHKNLASKRLSKNLKEHQTPKPIEKQIQLEENPPLSKKSYNIIVNKEIPPEERIKLLDEREEKIVQKEIELENKERTLLLKENILKRRQSKFSKKVKNFRRMEKELQNNMRKFEELLKNLEKDPKRLKKNTMKEIILKPSELYVGSYKKDNNDRIVIKNININPVLFLLERNAKICVIKFTSFSEISKKEIKADKNKILNNSKELISELISKIEEKGGIKENIISYLIGGSKNIKNSSGSYKIYTELIKTQLENNSILIEKQELGGLSNINLIYEVKNEKILVKKAWEVNYRILE